SAFTLFPYPTLFRSVVSHVARRDDSIGHVSRVAGRGRRGQHRGWRRHHDPAVAAWTALHGDPFGVRVQRVYRGRTSTPWPGAARSEERRVGKECRSR